MVRRDTSEKMTMSTDGLREHLERMLEEMQQGLFNAAKERTESNTHTTDDFEEYGKAVKEGGFYRIHWCGEAQCETRLQEKTKSTIRCIPFDTEPEEGKCIVCGNASSIRVIAAQGYYAVGATFIGVLNVFIVAVLRAHHVYFVQDAWRNLVSQLFERDLEINLPRPFGAILVV